MVEDLKKTAPSPGATSPPLRRREVVLRGIEVLVLLFIFLVGIRGMSTGFKGLGGDLLEGFFHATSNPFVGLTIGILATSLVQSSSVTTSMVVALVAAPENPLPIPNAVPIIMGANIGTTVTNTIVSLGHIVRPHEFKRAFAAATCHDFFNYMCVAILLPLELLFGILSKPAEAMAGAVSGLIGSGGKLPNPLKDGTKMALRPIQDLFEAIAPSEVFAAVILLLFSAGLIFVSLMFIVRSLRRLAATRLQTFLSRSLESSGFIGILVGIVVTFMVQSSSITTSILVPLAGAGLITVEQLFPVALGANIGTTFTALVASLAAPSETAVQAIEIALVHLIFNCAGTLLIFPFKRMRAIPIALSKRLGEVAVRSKKLAFFYVAGLFYGLPALLVVVTRYF